MRPARSERYEPRRDVERRADHRAQAVVPRYRSAQSDSSPGGE